MCVPAGLLSLATSIPELIKGGISVLNKRSDVDLAKYTKGVDGDVTVNVEEMKTIVALAQIGRDNRKNDQESKWTAWMLPSLFTVVMAHFSNVVLDRVTWFGHVPGSWGSVALPPEYANAELQIVLSTAGIATAAHVIKKVFSPK